jgi:hypothetical protein
VGFIRSLIKNKKASVPTNVKRIVASLKDFISSGVKVPFIGRNLILMYIERKTGTDKLRYEIKTRNVFKKNDSPLLLNLHFFSWYCASFDMWELICSISHKKNRASKKAKIVSVKVIF